MESAAWISIASICAVGAMSPGPSLAVVVRNTISGGRLQGVLTGIGHAIGVGIYALVAVFGMAMLLQQFPSAMRSIEICGGLYLIWMGIQSHRHAGSGSMESKGIQKVRGFVDGFAISGLNPKIAVFFLALLGPFVPVEASAIERFGVASLALMIDGCWYIVVAILLVQTGASDWLARQGLWVDRILAILLLGVGLWLIVN
ncbi:MAG: LysE family translocator [Myxococcota bacterium]|nr:LysE family translocator [Myxococcota bacterium]